MWRHIEYLLITALAAACTSYAVTGIGHAFLLGH